MSKPANVPSSNFDNTETTKANSFRFKSTSVAELKFPGCDAAVQKIDGGEWDLADAIVAECSETGDDGVQERVLRIDESDAARDRQKPRRRTVVRANPKTAESRVGFSTRSPATGCFARRPSGGRHARCARRVRSTARRTAPPSPAPTFGGRSIRPRKPNRTSKKPNAAAKSRTSAQLCKASAGKRNEKKRS